MWNYFRLLNKLSVETGGAPLVKKVNGQDGLVNAGYADCNTVVKLNFFEIVLVYKYPGKFFCFCGTKLRIEHSQ